MSNEGSLGPLIIHGQTTRGFMRATPVQKPQISVWGEVDQVNSEGTS